MRGLLIPAAGLGSRLGCEGPKALLQLGGRSLLALTLERFRELALIARAVIAVPPSHRAAFEAEIANAFPKESIRVVPGGAERQESVARALEELDKETEIVVIHDAARPFVMPEPVEASIAAASECGAATVALPCADTVLRADEAGYLDETLDRTRLWICQTPQTFQVEAIRQAHAAARDWHMTATDDATLVRCLERPVKLVAGSPLNFKITTPSDLALARLIVEEALL